MYSDTHSCVVHGHVSHVIPASEIYTTECMGGGGACCISAFGNVQTKHVCSKFVKLQFVHTSLRRRRWHAHTSPSLSLPLLFPLDRWKFTVWRSPTTTAATDSQLTHDSSDVEGRKQSHYPSIHSPPLPLSLSLSRSVGRSVASRHHHFSSGFHPSSAQRNGRRSEGPTSEREANPISGALRPLALSPPRSLVRPVSSEPSSS